MDTNKRIASQPSYYQIRVRGVLDGQWSVWFNGFTIEAGADGDTILIGPVVDQAALYGLISKARDLGLTLISVTPGVPEIQNTS
jgi:hypothetical protein